MTTNDWHTHAVQAAASSPDFSGEDRVRQSMGRGFTQEPDPDALTGDLAALTRVLLGVAEVVDKDVEPAEAPDVIDVAAIGTDEGEAPAAPPRMAPSRVINDLAFLDG